MLAHLGFFPSNERDEPQLPKWASDVMNAQTVDAFSTAVQNMYFPEKNPYWNHLYGSPLENSLCFGLCMYPATPNWCMSIGACPPEVPWLLRLDLIP